MNYDAERLHLAAEEHYAHDEALIATAQRLEAQRDRLRLGIDKALAALRCPNNPRPGLAEFILTQAVLEAGQ